MNTNPPCTWTPVWWAGGERLPFPVASVPEKPGRGRRQRRQGVWCPDAQEVFCWSGAFSYWGTVVHGWQSWVWASRRVSRLLHPHTGPGTLSPCSCGQLSGTCHYSRKENQKEVGEGLRDMKRKTHMSNLKPEGLPWYFSGFHFAPSTAKVTWALIDTWYTSFEKEGSWPYFPISLSAADSWTPHTDLKFGDIYCTRAAMPPTHCHVTSAFLATFYAAERGAPCPEFEIQSKFGQAAVAHKKRRRGNKGGGASEGTQREVRCNPLHSIRPAPLCFPSRSAKKEWNMVFIASWQHYLRMHISSLGWNANKGRKKFLI